MAAIHPRPLERPESGTAVTPARRASLPGTVALCLPLLLAVLLTAAHSAAAAIDLRNATVERLDNGLTLILLEDRRFPVASVQALYRVGARDEVTGKTGLAHFLEHMAFRDSRNFPGSGLASRIYAVGGEWHGYTWIDQTTYFETAPREHLDLLLAIEADRMARLLLLADDMEAERGSVLAEMHMYENDPATQLIDAVNFMSFLAHPYRNNTIGWESDIEKLEHRDVVEFYERHYQPANAVIAVVGDFDRGAVRERCLALFGNIAGRAPTPLPRTEEPRQEGTRRIELQGSAGPPQVRIAYRAPSANDADFPAFLVLQALLGTSSGVNFLQNDWGTPVTAKDRLAGAADDVSTWYPPSAQDYVFVIGGTLPAGSDPGTVETAIEDRVQDVRELFASEGVLDAAIAEVQDALVFDVETTEDAAHQLAFFDGLGALEVLLGLPGRVAAVTAGDVRGAARRWLGPGQRSIAWYLPAPENRGDATAAEPLAQTAAPGALAMAPTPPPGLHAVPAPTVARLRNGLPVLLQPSDLSDTVELRVVTAPGPDGDPVIAHDSLSWNVRAAALDDAIRAAGAAVAAAQPVDTPAPAALLPEARLEEEFAALMRPAGDARAPRPVLLALAGDFDGARARARLDEAFGAGEPPPPAAPPARTAAPTAAKLREVALGLPVAQAQLGYIVAAPGPRTRAADAWRLLLYVLAHDYEGRFGRKAIGDSGLAYYVDARYHSDGTNAWVTLSTGVDPAKLGALRDLQAAEIARLVTEPPTDAEIAEAKEHLLGRRRSAAQSNAELTRRLAADWLWYGELLDVDALAARLARVGRDDLVAAAAAFGAGTTLTVSE